MGSRAAGAHHDTQPLQVARAAFGRGERGLEDGLRLGHAPGPAVTAGELALFWAHDDDAPLAEDPHVVGRRGVPPHLGVHRRRHDDRCRGGE
jgi:hypothetical protein